MKLASFPEFPRWNLLHLVLGLWISHPVQHLTEGDLIDIFIGCQLTQKLLKSLEAGRDNVEPCGVQRDHEGGTIGGVKAVEVGT